MPRSILDDMDFRDALEEYALAYHAFGETVEDTPEWNQTSDALMRAFRAIGDHVETYAAETRGLLIATPACYARPA